MVGKIDAIYCFIHRARCQHILHSMWDLLKSLRYKFKETVNSSTEYR